MVIKPPVKVRKWVTCAWVGCKKRATVKTLLCGEHQKKEAAFKHERESENKIAADKAVRRKKRAAARAQWLDMEELRKKEAGRKTARGGHLKEKTAAAVKGSSKMTPARQAIPSPASRLIKAHCEKCHYTIRLSRKWIDIKRPMCPVCVKNMVTELDGAAEADPRQLPLKKIKKAKKKGGV